MPQHSDLKDIVDTDGAAFHFDRELDSAERQPVAHGRGTDDGTSSENDESLDGSTPAEHRAPTDENVAQAPKFGSLIAEADLAVGRVERIAETAFAAAQKTLSLSLPDVEQAIYAAIVDLERKAQIEEFMADRAVVVHGNVKNRYTPLVACFTKGRRPRVRQALAKFAAVIALARAEGVEPENFSAWRTRWPIEEACRAWRDRQPRHQDSAAKAVDFFLACDGQFLPQVGPTVGHVGRNLAVIDCAEDGGGRFRIVRVLPCGAADVRRVVKRAMRMGRAKAAEAS